MNGLQIEDVLLNSCSVAQVAILILNYCIRAIKQSYESNKCGSQQQHKSFDRFQTFVEVRQVKIKTG